MPHSSVQALVGLPLFDGLAAEARTRLLSQSFVQTEPARAVLFEQGQAARFLHVILHGRVALVGEAPSIDLGAAPEDGAIIEMFGPGEAVILAVPPWVATTLLPGLVAPDAFEARVSQLAGQIAAKSTFTLATGKRAFYRQLQMSTAEAYEYVGEVGVRNSIHPDAIEGIQAFIDKRPPAWRGRA